MPGHLVERTLAERLWIGRRVNGVLLLALALIVSLAAPARAAKDDLVLVSRANGTAGVSGDDEAGGASISADGRFVAFASAADNLSDEDGQFIDVFVRNVQTHTTTLVSRASGVAGAAGDDSSDTPSISADGRFVAFVSGARNLSDEDNDAAADIFVRDLLANTTSLVSRATTATGYAGDRFSAEPSISADGRLVAFASAADNLSDEDDQHVDVFVRDLHAHTTTLVSRATYPAAGNSNEPSISADGRFVAFHSDADNLSDEDDDRTDDVFVRDLLQRTTTLVSRTSSGPGDGHSGRPSISADGHLVAFESDARNLSVDDEDGNRDIFLRDLASGATALVSRASGVTGPAIDGGALEASISADGRFVAFEAEVNNPGGEAEPGQNIFVHDLQTNTTTFVSRAGGASGAAGDGDSFNPSISGDGRFVAFDSEADSLSSEDNDAFGDVFARDLLGAPSVPATEAPMPGSPVPASRPAAPVLGRLRISPRAFQAERGPAALPARRRRGAIVSFTLDRAASVRFTVERAGSGRRGGFTRRGRAGANRFRLTGRINTRRLRPARYRLIATPVADGRRGDTKHTAFRIKP
jgi:Tol biopolymer transport system component